MMLRDVQSEFDERNIPLRQVGVKDIRYPLQIIKKNGKTITTIATFNLYVNLPQHFRGTHMSRFIEVLNNFNKLLSWKDLKSFTRELKNKLDAKAAKVEIFFPFVIKKQAPISKMESYMSYDAHIYATMTEDDFSIATGIRVPVHTLCPCSKAISKHGAHNQRAYVNITIKSTKLVWLEELIAVAEKSATHDLYTLLKRVDEKHLTEFAYENPKFVEDVARDVAITLMEDPRIHWFTITVESMESIHNHQAYASVTWERGKGFWTM